MRVFLSWSGSRSKAVAESLCKWIGQVIQVVEPWISSDIEKGARWNEEIANKLEESKVGIICLTKDNLNARWILFECGAIAKTKDARVCTLLLDIDPTDVEQPLAQFQYTTRDKEPVRQLLQTINNAVERSGEKALTESVLHGVFETNWPRLSEALEKIASRQPPLAPVKRPDRELLEEILEIIRAQERLQVHTKQLRELLVEKEVQDGRVALELSKARLLSSQVGKHLAESGSEGVGGILSNELARCLPEGRAENKNALARIITEMQAEDEKKLKESRDEGQKGGT